VIGQGLGGGAEVEDGGGTNGLGKKGVRPQTSGKLKVIKSQFGSGKVKKSSLSANKKEGIRASPLLAGRKRSFFRSLGKRL